MTLQLYSFGFAAIISGLLGGGANTAVCEISLDLSPDLQQGFLLGR